MADSYLVMMARAVNAARVLRYASEAMPGDDLGASARALALRELYAALDELDFAEGAPSFNAKDGLRYLEQKDKAP